MLAHQSAEDKSLDCTFYYDGAFGSCQEVHENESRYYLIPPKIVLYSTATHGLLDGIHHQKNKRRDTNESFERAYRPDSATCIGAG